MNNSHAPLRNPPQGAASDEVQMDRQSERERLIDDLAFLVVRQFRRRQCVAVEVQEGTALPSSVESTDK